MKSEGNRRKYETVRERTVEYRKYKTWSKSRDGKEEIKKTREETKKNL